ncbi:alpha/beta fold hydrolase [Pseudaquabacterium terrae]|uniref:alpha/beta fold hydrolase n=1 Tax=Pseudaquabacterium terrae TaxID=2732868 RepID=UPI0031B5BAA1
MLDIECLGRGPRVLALHGIQGTRAAWLPVARRLAAHARFVLPNLRGRGRAPRGRGPGDYTLDAYAGDAAAAIERHAAGAPYFLAGWSMGVSVALALLDRRPELRPAGLILLSGTPCLAQARWFDGEGAALLAAVAAREHRLGLLQAADHDAVAFTWRAICLTDQRPLLPRIDGPALLLHGSADTDSPHEHARWLAEGLPQARLVTLAGAGHALLTEHTERVAAEIESFLAQHARPPKDPHET